MDKAASISHRIKPGRHPLLLEVVVVVLILSASFFLGYRNLAGWRLDPYDGHIMLPGLMWAMGDAFGDIRRSDPDLSRVEAFCTGETDVLRFEHPDGPPKTTKLSDIQRTHLYLGALAGGLWRVFGVHADVIKYLLLFLFCMNAVLLYALGRSVMGRFWAAAAVLLYVSNPSVLEYLVSVRDFSKAPFYTATFLILVLLLKPSLTRRRYFLLSIVLSLFVGIGLGFRRDMIVPATLALPVVLFVPSTLIRVRHRLFTVIAYVAIMAVISFPVGAFTRAVQGNDNDPDIVVSGFSRTLVRTLSLSRPSYTKAYPVLLDQAPFLVSQSAARSGATLNREQYARALAAPDADATFVKAYLTSTLQLFPADLVVRAFAAVNFLLQGQGIAMPVGVDWLLLVTPLAAITALFIIAMKSPWRATLLLYLILAFCGYTSLNFQSRYAFHLYYIPFLIWGAAFSGLWHIPSAWKKYRTDLYPSGRMLVRGLVWGMFMLVPVIGSITALGFLQERQILRIRDAYCSADRVSVTPSVTPWNGGVLYGVDVMDEDLIPKAFGKNTIACNVFVVELIYPGEPMVLGMSYYSPTEDMFSYYVSLGLKDVKAGDKVQVFIPAYEDYALPPDSAGYLLFNGFVVQEGCEETLSGIYRLNHEGLFPLTLAVNKTGEGFIPRRHLDIFNRSSNVIFRKGAVPLGDFYYTAEDIAKGRNLVPQAINPDGSPLNARQDSPQKLSRYRAQATEIVPSGGSRAVLDLFGQLLEAVPNKHGAFLQLFYHCTALLELSPVRLWHELNQTYPNRLAIELLEKHALYLTLTKIDAYRTDVAFIHEQNMDFLALFDRFSCLDFGDVSAYLDGCKALANYWEGIGDKEKTRSMYYQMANYLETDICPTIRDENTDKVLKTYMAEFWFNAGEYDKVLQLDHASFLHRVVTAYGDMADDFFKQGKFDKAKDYYCRAIELKTQDVRHYLCLGTLYQKEGRFEEALEMYTKVLTRAPESPITAEHINALYTERDDSAGLVSKWRELCAEHTQAATPQLYLGMALEEQGKLQEALTCYERAVQLDNPNTSAYIRLGTLQVLQKQFKTGETSLEKALEIGTETTVREVRVVYGDLGDTFFKSDELSLAEKYYRRAIALGSEDIQHYSGLGKVYQKRGATDAALEMYTEVLKRAPESPVTAQSMYTLYLDRGDIPGLLTKWRDLCAEQPDAVTPQLYLGMALEEQGELQEALTCYERAVQLDDTNATAHIRLGTLQIRQGLLKAGEASFDKALSIAPENATREVRVACGDLAETFLEKGEFDLAENYYRQTLDLGTEDVRHYVGLGKTYQKKGATDAAVEMYTEVLKRAPESPETAESIDQIYLERGDKAGLVEIWRTLTALQPEAAIPRLHLGMGYEATGDTNAAVAAYQRALQVNPALESAKKRMGALQKE